MIISVCIPCHIDHIPELKRTIIDLVKQTRKPDEIIVFIKPLPRQETDKIRDEITTVFNEYNKNDENTRLDLLFDDQTSSMGFAKSRCIEFATGELVMTMDCDDRVHRQKIEIIERLFEENENYDVLVHNYINNNIESLSRAIDLFSLIIKKCKNHPRGCGLDPEGGGNVHHAHASFRRKTTLDKDEIYFEEGNKNFGADDSIILSKLVDMGCGVYFIDYPLIIFDRKLSKWKAKK